MLTALRKSMKLNTVRREAVRDANIENWVKMNSIAGYKYQ